MCTQPVSPMSSHAGLLQYSDFYVPPSNPDWWEWRFLTGWARFLSCSCCAPAHKFIHQLPTAYGFAMCIFETRIGTQVPNMDFRCSISISKKSDTSIVSWGSSTMLSQTLHARANPRHTKNNFKSWRSPSRRAAYLAGPFQWGHVCLQSILYLSRQGS